MDQAIGHDLIENYERHIESLSLPDPDDRHVLAAAIEAGAEILLTYNRRDFSESVAAAYGISVLHPDAFLRRVALEEAETVLSVIEEMRVKRKRPEMSQAQLLEKLARLSIPGFVGMLQDAGYGSHD